MNFAARLKDELEYQGLRMSDLAKHLGTKQSTIQGWIDRGSIPAADTALKIAHFLNVSIEYLLTGEDSETERKSTIKDFVTDEEYEYLIKYRNLPAHDKVMMKKIIDAAYESLLDRDDRIVAEGMQA